MNKSYENNGVCKRRVNPNSKNNKTFIRKKLSSNRVFEQNVP